MGLSGQSSLLLNLERVRRDAIPVIKRYSGGGTVVIDENTLFVSLIFSKDSPRVTISRTDHGVVLSSIIKMHGICPIFL